MTHRIIFIGGRFGPDEWEPVMDDLARSGVVSTVPIVPDLTSLSLPESISGSYWHGPCSAILEQGGVGENDFVVGLEDGAGPAARMISAREGLSGVIVNPAVGAMMRRNVEIVGQLPRLGPEPGEMAERLAPHEDEFATGQLSGEAISILLGAYTGDEYRVKLAEIAHRVLPQWLPLDRRIVPSDDDVKSADWLSIAQRDPRLAVWYTREFGSVSPVIQQRFGIPISLMPWRHGAWLTQAEVVADSLRHTLGL